MNSDPSKSWSIFFKPVKKDQCFDVDIGKILEDFKHDYEQKEKVNFTEAALVIQGAVHTVGLKIDKLHKDAMDLVEYLAAGGDQNEEGVEGEAAASRKKRITRKGDPELDFIKKVMEQPGYMGEDDDFYSDEDEYTLKDDEFDHADNLKEEDFLPERDHFFTDLHGKSRGKEVRDMDNESYICQRNDLWIYRAPFTSNGYIYPQSRDQQRKFGKRHEEPKPFEYDAFLDESQQKDKTTDGPMPIAEDFQFEQQSFRNFEPELELTHGSIAPNSGDNENEGLHENNRVESISSIPVSSKPDSVFAMPAAQALATKENPRRFNNFEETYRKFLEEKTSHRMFAFNKEETLSFNTDRWKFDENIDKRPPKSYEFQWPSMKPTAFVKVLDRATIKWEAKKYDALRQKSLAQIAKQKREFNKTMREFCAMKSLPPLRRTKAGQPQSTEELKDLISDNFAPGTAAEEIQAELEEFAPQEIVHESTAANLRGGSEEGQFEEATRCFPPPVDDGDFEDNPYDPTNQEPFTGESMGTGTLNMTRLRSVASGGSGVLRGNLPDTEIEANVLNWKRAIAPKLDQEAKLPDFNIRSLISEMDTMLSTSCVEDDDSVGCKELFADLPPWQKSRKFAAMLQMANEMKIEIIPPEDESDPIGKFSVKPITGERIHCAGDNVDPHAVTQKRFRALSSPKSSESPAPKRKHRK